MRRFLQTSTVKRFQSSVVVGLNRGYLKSLLELDYCCILFLLDSISCHKTLSLKIPNVEFDFDVSDCMMQVVTDTSKISMRPYNSVQMSNST